MAVDPAYGNSSGYFRDPSNGEELSVDTPRVIQCELKDGKFIWPQVAAADGSQLLKIVYKLFTDEEKDLYKQYRGRSSSGEPRPRKEKPVKVEKSEEQTTDEPIQVVKYSEESAAGSDSKEIIAKCDRCLGVSQIAGITYALLSKYGSNVVYHVPRSCIPDSEYTRLCGGF